MESKFSKRVATSQQPRRSVIAALGSGLVSGCLRLQQGTNTDTPDEEASTPSEARTQPEESTEDGEDSAITDPNEPTEENTEISDPLQITDATGLLTDDGTALAVLNFTIELSPDWSNSPNLSLLEVTITYQEETIVMTHARSGSGFYVDPVQNTGQRIFPGKPVQVKIPLGSSQVARDYSEEFAAADPLPGTGTVENSISPTIKEGQQVDIAIRITGGLRAEATFNVPDSLADENEPVRLDSDTTDT